jgi:hypothetical protein
MPRLDFEEAVMVGLASEEEIEVEERDPGMFGPFDLCIACYDEWSCESGVEHPPYSDSYNWRGFGWQYTCGLCKKELTEEDD